MPGSQGQVSHHPDTLVVMDASAGAMMPVRRMGLEEKLAGKALGRWENKINKLRQAQDQLG